MQNAVPPADQVHIDLGALAQRVTGTERAIDDVNGRLDGLGTQLNNLASSFATQMSGLSDKIDKRLETKPTNWIGFTTAAAAIVGVMLTIGGAIMVPVFGDLRELGDTIKSVQTASATEKEMEETNRTLRSRDDKLAQSIEDQARDKIGTREHDEYKAHITSRIDDLAKSVDARLGELEKTFDSRFAGTISRLDALSARISEGAEKVKN